MQSTSESLRANGVLRDPLESRTIPDERWPTVDSPGVLDNRGDHLG
jgi:hypothetical protein